MTINVLSRPSQLGKELAAVLLAAVREDPQIRAELRAVVLSVEGDAWQVQKGSPLGPRRHRAEVRRLVAAGDSRARIVGRRFEMRRDLLEEVLVAHGRRQVATAAEREADSDDLASELGLELA